MLHGSRRGDARGRELGFPTANLSLGEYLEPAHGIYAVKAGIDEGRATRWRDGVASLGTRPTVARRWLTWAWPALLAVMATVLLLYRET